MGELMKWILAFIGCYRLHQPSPFNIRMPMEGTTQSRPRCKLVRTRVYFCIDMCFSFGALGSGRLYCIFPLLIFI